MAFIARWHVRALLGLTVLMLLLGLAKRLDSLQQGLTGQYFFSPDSTAAPVHVVVDAPPSTERLEAAWNPPVPSVFYATWSGALLVLHDDLYTFATVSDDGSHLYIDGELVVDNGGSHGPERKSGSVHLTRGVHAIFVDYSQEGGGYVLGLLWSRGGRALEPLPARVLATRRVGLPRFIGSVFVWQMLAAAEWIWFAALLLVVGRLALRALLPLRRALIRQRTWPTLRWILLGSLGLNLAGIWWGLPGTWVAIELTPKLMLDGLTRHYSHGWFDAYPPFHYYVLSAVISPTLLLSWLGRIDLFDASSYTLIMLSFRLVSVAAACGIVVAVCLSGTRAFGPRAGVLAAGVFALVAPFLYYAKTANVDVPYLFWFAASMVVYLRLLDRLLLRDFVLFSACATLSVCTKDQAYGMYLLMPLPIVAQIARVNRQHGMARPFWRAFADRRLMAAALTAAVLFAVIHNLAFNLGGFREHLAFIVGPGSVTYRTFDATIAGRLELARLSVHLIQESFGWPFFVAAGIGLGIAAASRRLRLMAIWLIVPAVSYYFGFISVVGYNYDRFVLPICFVLAIFAGLALDRLVSWRSNFRRLGIGFAGVLFAYSLLYATTVDALMIWDSRYAVEQWLGAHVAPHDLVASAFSFEYLPRLDRFDHAEITTADDLQLRRPAYYVLNADYAHAGSANTPTGQLVAGLEAGTLGYQQALRFRRASPWPWLPWAHPDLVGPRHSKMVFSILYNINPTIVVFQRESK